MTKEEIRAEAIRLDHEEREERATVMQEVYDKYKDHKTALIDECQTNGGHNYRPAFYNLYRTSYNWDDTALKCQWCNSFIIVSHDESESILDKQKGRCK